MQIVPYFWEGAAWLAAALWGATLVVMALGRRSIRQLRDVDPGAAAAVEGAVEGAAGEGKAVLPDGAPWPRLAVIVPALNEEAGVRAALVSLLRQDYPDLLIVPVNDRSTDRTGAIMDEIAAAAPSSPAAAPALAAPGRPRIVPIHVHALPAEWLGKNHANHLGAGAALRAGAEWLLFTDGDVQFSPATLRKAITWCRARALTHLTVAPELIYHSFGEAILLTTFLILFVTRFRPWFVEHPRARGYVGIGAFNLIRADAYATIGGHAPLALTVADDVALGKLVRDAGLKRGFLEGTGEVKVAWQPDLLGIVRGLYKNCFAALDFSRAKSAVTVLFVLFATVLPFLLPALTTGPARIAASAALACLVTVYAGAAAIIGRPPAVALAVGACAWFGGLLMAWTVAASTVITLRQKGVVWRGTHYPMALLRARQVRV